ncbi:MAG TPA: hypothetical protein VIJ59_03810 [Caulobacteraceae bacterium]
MSPLTIYLARFLGVACLLLCAALAARPKTALAAIDSIRDQPGLLLVTGIFTMAGGAAMVVGHNQWSDGALTIVVTALGWLILIKGFAVMAAPSAVLAVFYLALGYPGRFRLVMAIGFLLSLWLTWAGFTAEVSIPI